MHPPAAPAVRTSALSAPRRRGLLQYVSLLYTVTFFVEPWQRHTLAAWLWFALVYAVFLALYFAIPLALGRRQAFLLAALFALGFVYYPFNPTAAGIFVYPVVLIGFVLPSIRPFLLVLALQIAAIAAETWLAHLPPAAAESGIFFCVVIGLSNFVYFQEQSANARLQSANDEIADLTQAAERERIARDLHDLLGHTLTLITVKLDLARRLLPADPERAKIEITDAERTARNALADVREAVVGYRSQGLAAEITRIRHTLHAAEIELSTAIVPVAMAAPQTDVLCLALREAATNIVRHANARSCSVELQESRNGLDLTITDDGTGMARPEGAGLRGMRERVAAVGGSLHMTPAAPRGTCLRITLPRA